MDRRACIFGSTGLIGSHLLNLLVNDKRYSKIIVFNRKHIDLDYPKVKQVVADYEQLDEYANDLSSNDFFCCLGTTIKKAKTKTAFEYVDYQLPLNIANLALKNKVEKYLVVSSIGAAAKSGNFYLRTKGKMEEDISGLGIQSLHFFRPSLLLGKRKEKRFTESFSKAMMTIIGFMFVGKLKKYKAIHAEKVAAAMVAVANSEIDEQVFQSNEIETIGSSYLNP